MTLFSSMLCFNVMVCIINDKKIFIFVCVTFDSMAGQMHSLGYTLYSDNLGLERF